MNEIIKTEDRVQDELCVRYVFGLDLFGVNGVQLDEDLEVTFLRAVGREILTSAHTGMLLDFGNAPEELFGPSTEELFYKEVSVGVSRGDFYRVEDWPYFTPCFFPQVTESFWKIFDRSEDASWYKILYSDAMAFYLDPYRRDFVSEMEALFRAQPVPKANWLKEVLQIYRAVILSVGDMNYFKVYARDSADFQILDESLREMENSVIDTDWYQANKHNLAWDADRGLCLRLKAKEDAKALNSLNISTSGRRPSTKSG